MLRLRRFSRMLVVLAIGGGLTSQLMYAGEPAAPTVHIGMIQTLFRGSDSRAMLAMSEPFGRMLHAQTGLRGELSVAENGEDLARQLADGRMHLGFLHGIEYAWIKEKHPELKTLLLAFNQTIRLKGFVLVREDCSAQGIAELQGKPLAFPVRSLNHCHLFLHETIREAGLTPAGFFAEMPAPANTMAALDAVVDGTAAVTVVDGVSFDLYRERKPGRANRLRVLRESEYFPTATVIYRPGTVDESVLRKFRDGMTTAHQRVLGRQLLNLWRLSEFSEVPAEYHELLADVARRHPKPFQPARFVAADLAGAAAATTSQTLSTETK